MDDAVAYQFPDVSGGMKMARGCGVIVPVGVGKRMGVIVGVGVAVEVEDGGPPLSPRTGKSCGSDVGPQL